MYTPEELQRLYDYAWNRYLAEDYVEAFECFKEIADTGHAEATTMVGVLYSNELFVGHDYEKAIAYLRLAVERGDNEAFSALGEIYRDGRGVEQNGDKALE